MEPAAAEVLESLRRAPRVGGHSSRGSEDSGVGGSAGAAHAGHCPPLLHADAVLRCLDKSHDSEACTLCVHPADAPHRASSAAKAALRLRAALRSL
jgi:hypothetical protein